MSAATLRLACVSREDLPAWEVDDRPLHAALQAMGVEVSRPAWSDAGVDWSGFDALLLRTPWDYQERLEPFLAWTEQVARQVPLWHGPDVVRWNARKTYLRDLAACGVPIAPSYFVHPEQPEALVRALEGLHGRAFLKPVVGATARHTLRFDAGDVARAEAFLAEVGEPMILQPYLPAVETEGELSVVVLDGAASHGVRKVPVAGDYRVQDDFGATDERVPIDAELGALADRALAAASQVLGRSEPWLYARVDALRWQGHLVLNELEVIEPSLFFRHAPEAADRFARALVTRLHAVSGASRR